MPDLVIRIKKKTDGSAALSCTRADGSVTWQRQDGKLGLFFPLHDLTHYAVETTLGFSRAFYGLRPTAGTSPISGSRSIRASIFPRRASPS